MPIYDILCEECGHVEEYYCSFADWDIAKAKGDTPFPKKCPKCKSKKFHRVIEVPMLKTETSPEQQASRLKNQMKEDTKKLMSGDIDFIKNLAGTQPTNAKSGVKYMKDVKNPKIKRKS